MMKPFSVELVQTGLKPEDYPPGVSPEVAFVGRSNVGKSSLINALLQQKIARVSSTPGKTRQIFFYKVNRSFCFVDLPGYGFANVPKWVKASWSPALESYLDSRTQLRGVVLVLDARHPPTQLDLRMKQWLDAAGIRFLAVITKIDKIPWGARHKTMQGHKSALGLDPGHPVLVFSAKTGEGRAPLFKSIEKLIASRPIE